MAILQASSTQNDLVVSLWLVSLTYFLLKLMKKPSPTWAVAAGLALGLALLTKPTGYFFALPFLIWLAICLFSQNTRYGLKLLGLIAVIVLVLNLGFWTRNIQLWGSPVPDRTSTTGLLRIETFNLRAFSSNLIRNVSLHLGVGPQANLITERAIYRLHDLVGFDANDEATTWTGTTFHVQGPSTLEDYAGNFAHLLIGGFLATWLLIRNEKSRVTIFIVCIVAGFALFSLLLKWQPWHSRLHLPLFLLGAPIAGIGLAKIRRNEVSNLAGAILLLGTLPWLLLNLSRPILGPRSILVLPREVQYFSARPELLQPFMRTVSTTNERGCKAIGLIMGEDDWEYPFWALTRREQIIFHHVNVYNESRLTSSRAIPLCGLITQGPNYPTEIRVGGQVFALTWEEVPLRFYTEIQLQ